MSLPHVILHNAVSLDGRIDHFALDVGQYYELAATWEADCSLTGSDTIILSLQAAGIPPDSEMPEHPPSVDPEDTRPLLVVTDSRGRVRNWQYLREVGHWRDVMALCSRSTPKSYLKYLELNKVSYLIAGDGRIDLRQALELLGRDLGIKIVRVDSGGTLNGALLRAGLVNEVSVLVYPALVGGFSPASLYRAPDLKSAEGVIDLELRSFEKLPGGVMWLRYDVQ